MQDRYLFRGKCVNNGDWIVGTLCPNINIVYIVYDDDFYTHTECNLTSLMADRYFEVDSVTIGQCTGLKDKNGKLIFEGDVLKVSENELKYHPDSNKKCVVIFGHYGHYDASLDYVCGDYGFYLDWINVKHKLLRNDLIYWQGNNYIEIIGNIHDNPELLPR